MLAGRVGGKLAQLIPISWLVIMMYYRQGTANRVLLLQQQIAQGPAVPGTADTCSKTVAGLQRKLLKIVDWCLPLDMTPLLCQGEQAQ